MIEFENDPHTDAERRVLACVLHEPTQIRHVAHWLKPVHFAHDAHGQIWRHMLALHERGERITVDTVYDLMRERRRVHQGLLPLLVRLMQIETTFPHVAFHAVPLKLRAGVAYTMSELPEEHEAVEDMCTGIVKHINGMLKKHRHGGVL